MSADRDPTEGTPGNPAGDGPMDAEDPREQDRRRRAGEHGAESYEGDPDAEPSVTEEEVDAGMERDQAEG